MAEDLTETAYERARQVIPGGVNSPVRAFDAVQETPIFAKRGQGAYLYDIEGRRYVDCLMSWGALILGHGAPEVTASVRDAIGRGAGYGLCTRVEAELGKAISEAVPGVEQLRLVNSGTEALMSAVRLARAHTGRDKIIVFAGGYHGHADSFLANAGSGLATFGIPRSAGIPDALADLTLVARYNDPASVEALLDEHRGEVACVVAEPVAGNMGVVPPRDDFLQELRRLCDSSGALLVLDEVITGFRVGPGGAQGLFGVRADISTFGKIVGGGLPVGAFGGRRDIMERLAPLGDVYQAGTLSGNPVVASAGLAVLRRLRQDPPYERLEGLAARLASGLRRTAQRNRVPLQLNRCGSMFTAFFAYKPVRDYQTARAADGELYARFFRGMLQRGVLLPPSPFESAFLSTAHTEEDIARTVEAAEKVLADVATELQSAGS